ncbi:hypothetical protein THAOC_18939, partial [Thalassiosira oceanica]
AWKRGTGGRGLDEVSRSAGCRGDSGDVPGRWPALDAWAEPAYALCKCCHHHHERERLLQGSMACFAGEGVVTSVTSPLSSPEYVNVDAVIEFLPK